MASAKLPAGGGDALEVAELLPVALPALLTDIAARDFLAADTRLRLYEAMLALAEACVVYGLTQAAAEILAFLLLQHDISSAVRDRAEDALVDLESRICPRIIFDAREFAAGMDLNTMVEYLIEVLESEPNLTLAQRRPAIA